LGPVEQAQPTKDTAGAKKYAPAVPLTKKDKFEQLAAVRKQLDKQLDTTNSIVRLGSRVGQPVPSIPTNLPTLDYGVIGSGGIPRGRMIEIFGPESSGKTTLCLHIVAQEQANTDNLCAIVDAEHAIDVSYAAKLGVNVDELLVSQPSSGEDALETIEALVDSGLVSIIIVDSVAALVPRAELDGEAGDSAMGLQARLMSQACRKLTGKAALKQVTIIWINQLREKIGVMFGSPETTTGGKALKFYASVRLDVRRKDVIGPKESPIGHTLKVKAVKNKMGVPMKETFIDLIYDSGIDTFADFVSYSLKIGALKQSGPWVKFGEINIASGLTNAVNALRLDKELFKQIKVETDKLRKEQSVEE
jgi:recombination protein RecA